MAALYRQSLTREALTLTDLQDGVSLRLLQSLSGKIKTAVKRVAGEFPLTS